jgi:hypothetical protein
MELTLQNLRGPTETSRYLREHAAIERRLADDARRAKADRDTVEAAACAALAAADAEASRELELELAKILLAELEAARAIEREAAEHARHAAEMCVTPPHPPRARCWHHAMQRIPPHAFSCRLCHAMEHGAWLPGAPYALLGGSLQRCLLFRS